jgi:hypothetical protein
LMGVSLPLTLSEKCILCWDQIFSTYESTCIYEYTSHDAGKIKYTSHYMRIASHKINAGRYNF